MDLVTDELRPSYRRWLIKALGPAARELGWTAKKGESDATRILRPEILAALSYSGDAATRAEATTLAKRWLSDRKGIDPDMISTALVSAARGGDKALFDQTHAVMLASTDATDRGRLQLMLAAFDDPALFQSALSLILSEEVTAQEASMMFFYTRGEANRTARFAFYLSHLDQLIARFPIDYQSGILYTGSEECTAQRRADLEKSVAPRAAGIPGGPRVMEQVLERVDLCLAAKNAVQAGMAEFLKAQ